MRLMARLVGITEKCVKRIEAEIRSNLPDFPKIVQLREQMLTPLDLVSFNRDLQGRFGQPTRTVQDVKHEGLSKTPLIILDSGEDEAWEGRTNGAAHAAPPDGD
jgi:hypothetical protein